MVATRQDKHINIDILTRYLPPRLKHLMGGVVRFFTAGVCCAMVWQGVNLVSLDFGSGTIAFNGVPAWGCELIIPVGFAVMAMRYLILSVDYLKRASGLQP
jgi:TRAP-type C4-dicarboxylate transport system permease small subunit